MPAFKVIRMGVVAITALLALSLTAQGQTMPSQGRFAAAPDAWLISEGQPWHHRTSASPQPRALVQRTPTSQEAKVIEKAQHLLKNNNARAMALMDGDFVLWVGYKPPVTSESTLFGFSMGKTITALAVGQAICAGKLSLSSRASEQIPELAGTDLGSATVADLLTMRSGTWEGFPDSTVWTTDEARAIGAGQMDWVQLLSVPRVNTAVSTLSGKRKPGEQFRYRSTDPLTLGVMLARATGMTYGQWVEAQVLMQAGIATPAFIARDRAKGYGQGDGAVRMKMEDWMRLAAWTRAVEVDPGCLGGFVRDAMRSHSGTGRPPASGYGYLTWIEGSTSWAVGHGGQRIAWNRDNNRILVVFSGVEDWMPALQSLYTDWRSVQ